MPNVIAIVQDDRIRRQLEQFFEELGMEDLRYATFKSGQEFQNLYFRERQPVETPPPEAESAEGAEQTELKLFSEIHAIVFALDSIPEKSGPWLDKMRIGLRHFKYWPENGTPRFVMLKYEDDGISKLDVLHSLLDDLIYLPLDRLIFLQKMQIFLELPKKASPRFLFSQEVRHDIEISKISKIDRLNDVAIAIRNPVPLKKGLPGHFYVTFPGEKNRSEIYGKVLKSEPHPDFPGQYLVYFTFFGLHRNVLTQIRKLLSKAPRYQSLIKDTPDNFRYNPDDLFMDASDRVVFGLVIVDPDESAGSNLAEQLNKEMDRLEIIQESSYQTFLYKYLQPKGSEESGPPQTAGPEEFFHVPISISVNAADLKCLSVDPGPTAEHKFLGHQADTLFASPDGWLSVIQENESNSILQEAALLASRGKVVKKLLTLRDSAGLRRAVNFKFSRGEADGVVTVEISPSDLNDIVEKKVDATAKIKMNLAIFDANFVPEDPASWIEGLRMRASQLGFCDNPEQLKFFVTTEGEPPVNSHWNTSKDILGLFGKPIDIRQITFLLSEYLPNSNTMYRFDNLGWSQPQLPVHVAKELHLEALSEFGATLKSRQIIVPGTVIFLRKSIYEHAPNGCLAARVYSCQEHPTEKNEYQILTTYFGINDAFLKFARTWIREYYASQKQNE